MTPAFLPALGEADLRTGGHAYVEAVVEALPGADARRTVLTGRGTAEALRTFRARPADAGRATEAAA